MATRLEILEASLAKKQASFDKKLKEHFDTVAQANGQPLNDKRNGRATLNKWERQDNALRSLQESIDRTKEAIEREKSTANYVERITGDLPERILEMIEAGELIQWRKYPNMFFVPGVNKARIIWDAKKQIVAHKFVSSIVDAGAHQKFARVYNELYAIYNNK